MAGQQLLEEAVLQVGGDVALAQRHELHAPAGAAAVGVHLDGALYLRGHVGTGAAVVVHGAVVVELEELAAVGAEVLEELVGQVAHVLRGQGVEFLEDAEDVPRLLGEDHGEHVARVHACLEGAAGVEVAQGGRVLLPAEGVAVDDVVQVAVGVEVLHREVAVEHLGGLQAGDDGEDVAGRALEALGELVVEPVFAQDVGVDVAGGYEEEGGAAAHLFPPLAPAFHGAPSEQHLPFGFSQPGAQGGILPDGGGQLLVLLQPGDVLALGIVVDKGCLHQEPEACAVVHLGVLQHPVVLAQVVGVGHVGSEGTAAVPDAVAVLDAEASDGLQQVGELILREILHLVAEHPDV